MKVQFRIPHNSMLRSLVRSAMALPFVPIKKMGKAMKIIAGIAEELEVEEQTKFAIKFIVYLENQWIRDYDEDWLKDWNFYSKKGSYTNNPRYVLFYFVNVTSQRLHVLKIQSCSEGLNNKISNNTDGVVKHPSIFVWYQMAKEKLEVTDTNANMALVGNPNLKKYNLSTKRKKVQTTRINLMLNLKDCTITLADYMLSFGSSIDCKDTDDLMDDIEDELEKEEELAKAKSKAAEEAEKPGGHSKVSKKKHENVSGILSSKLAEELEKNTPKEPIDPGSLKAKAKKKLSMEL